MATCMLGAASSLLACVQQQDLEDQQALMSASEEGTGGSESSGDSDSATSTTGQAPGCAANDGTLTSLVVHTGPEGNPVLSGISDVAIHGSGAVDVAFIQGDTIWAEIGADDSVAFPDPPGTLSHVGFVDADADGRRLVGLDWWNGPDAGDWLQMIGADGTTQWNAAVFQGGEYSNLPDEHLVLADGTALVHVYWVDDLWHSRLTHFDASGTATASDQREDATIEHAVRDMVQAPNGDVWALRQIGTDAALDRYAAGAFAEPAQSIAIAERWAWHVDLDSNGRLVVASNDPNWNPDFEPTIGWLEIRDAADGAVLAAFSSADTEGFGVVNAIATGPCGEIFVAGADAGFASWVARIDDDGVVWSDSPEAEGAMFADVVDDGTLVVVGQTSAMAGETLTVAPYVARYEP